MQYEIQGGAYPIVVCRLQSGEKMITEKGSMVYMTPNMQMETRGGGIGKMFSKALSGESMFQRPMILQKNAFLAAEPTVELAITFKKKLGAGFFGGEGFIMQRLSGRGMAFVEIDGELMEYVLAPGQSLLVDTGNVAGYEESVSMEIQQVEGLKNKLLGGEGFFHTRLTGPGKVWIQTMPISTVASALIGFMPSGN